MNRTDVVLADGTFRVVLSRQHRLYAVIHAPRTPIGSLHLAFELDRGIHPDLLHRHALALRGLHPPYIMVGGIFDDIGKAVSRAAQGAFNTASKVATTIARPAFDVTKTAASHVMKGIASATPFLPAKARQDIASAARVVARARLGDMTAQQFLRTVGEAAKAGVAGARKVGNLLLDGSRLVTKVADLPMEVVRQVPGVGNVIASIAPLHRFDLMTAALKRGDFGALERMVRDVPIARDVVASISPAKKWDRIGEALERGDFKALERMVKEDLSMAQGALSLLPGIGTGISAAISAGLAALEGGRPLEIAVRTAYGAIPIPPGLRQATDAVLASVLELARGANITDVALAAARERVPQGVPRDVFDTLVRIVIRRVPVQKAAASLASHYVRHYGGAAARSVLDPALARVALPGGATRVLRAAPRVLQPLRVAGEETVADIAVAGEDPEGFNVAGEGPIAGDFDVAGEDPEDFKVAGEEPVAGDFSVAGEDPEGINVAGEDPEGFNVAGEPVAIPPALAASLANPAEWVTTQAP